MSTTTHTYIPMTEIVAITNASGWSENTYILSATDSKLQVGALTSGTTYYPILSVASTVASTKQYDRTGLVYVGTTGTASTVGSSLLTLGNSTASGTSANKQGQLKLFGSTAYAHTIQGAPTANRTLTLPDATGTVALTSDIPTVPTITLNGSTTTSPSFYAPTSVGTSGQLLRSSGSGAPTWVTLTTPEADEIVYSPLDQDWQVQDVERALDELHEDMPTITLNGSSTTTPSFYAPTTAGTSEYYLKSNGSGAPTWAEVSTTAAQIIRW